MNLTWDTCVCAQRKRFSNSAIVARYRASRVTKGAPVEDVKANRRQIIRDMVRMRRHLMVEGQKTISNFLTAFFEKKLGLACDRVEQALLARPHLKAVDLDMGGGEVEAIWRDAIEDALGTAAAVELVTHYQPIVQSIAAKAHARTALFLGETEHINASVNILRRSQNLAKRVTRINETTRKRLAARLEREIAEGTPVGEIARKIREDIPEITRGRVPTIARTEVGNAIDEGTKEAIKNSKTVTLVSVVGCQAIEPDIPTFEGRPTCNITNVPADRVDELEFHVNHTGCIVPSGYVTDRR